MDTILEKIKGKKIAVIGDVMLDHYVWGDAHRISPEAPVPVVHVGKDTFVPGGAANVALNINAMGGSAVLIGKAANDDAGGQLSTKLHAAGVSFDSRFCKCLAPTILKTRVIVRNQQLCRIDRESEPSEYSFDGDEELLSLIDEKIKDVDGIIFSDYSKGVVTESLINRIQATAAERGIMVALDPKPRRRIRFKEMDLITPNRAESILMAGVHVGLHDKFPAREICEKITQEHAVKNLVVTLGGEGMMIASNDGSGPKFIPTMAREVFDVSGAGDTVVAALTLGLVADGTLEDAANFANHAAGVVVSKIGTATATPEEIIQHANNSSTALV